MQKKTPDLRQLLGKIEADPRFSAFLELLFAHNARYNLTAIREREEAVYKHFLDCAAGESLFPVGAHVVEVGSGAGFPSIPLKLLRGDLRFTLIESTGKKCAFLREAIKELQLDGMQVLHARAEDVARLPDGREVFDAVCARAVAPMNTLAEYCLPLVRKGGVFVAYKGEAREELQAAQRAIYLLGGRGKEEISFELPEGRGARTIVCIEKVRETPAKYPRGNGRERKEPIA